MDEEAFLGAISAAPDDGTVRLVYADWLEERNDPRAEFVRLQVRLWGVPPDDPARPTLRARERELREKCPAYWLARLDPPVWCVVGNVVDTRPATGTELPLRGTRLFRPNAKVYLATRSHWYAILDPNRYGFLSIEVVGQHRQSRKWIGSWVVAARVANWRVRLIHHPGALTRLREAGWPGFSLRPHEFQCPAERDSVETLQRLFDTIQFTASRPSEA